MTASDAILLEDQARDARVIEEATPVCLHGYVTVFSHISGSPLDDHSTQKVRCNDCKRFLVLTDFANGRTDESPMSAAEIAEIEAAALAERYTAFLDQLYSGIL